MGLCSQSCGGTSTFYQGPSASPSDEPPPATGDSVTIRVALPTLLESSVTTPNSDTYDQPCRGATDRLWVGMPDLQAWRASLCLFLRLPELYSDFVCVYSSLTLVHLQPDEIGRSFDPHN